MSGARPGEDPPWLSIGEPELRTAGKAAAGSSKLQPGEVHLHWRGLVPALLAIVAAFPFEVNPIWSAFVAVLVLLVFTVRLHAPRTGRLPTYLMQLLLVALAVVSLLIADQVGLAPRSMVGQFVAFTALAVMLLPPETYRTFTACVVCLMCLVANGLMRTDLEYTFCLGGFLITLPGLMTLGHAHETVRARGLAWRSQACTTARKMLRALRSAAEGLLTVGCGLLIFMVVPKPAVMPLSDGRFAGVSNSFQDSVDVGRGPIPRGGQPFLFITAPSAPYLLGQVFDRYDGGRWSRTPGIERTTLDRRGRFELPIGVDGVDGAQPVRRAEVRLARDLPDLLLLPEGASTFHCSLWHVMGNPPLHLRAWGQTPLTTYAVDYQPPVRLEMLSTPHTPVGGEKSGLTWGKGAKLTTPPGDGPPASASLVPKDVDPRVVALAREWTRDCATDAARVKALFEKLGERCRYDTAALTPRGADPVAHLLFEARAGYCMHFATALALMARIVGVPARLATGYAPGSPVEGTPATGQRTFAVRPRDAHAWTHVWIQGHGWITIDATEGILVSSIRDAAEDFLAGDPLSPAQGVTLDLPVIRTVTRAMSQAGSLAQQHATLLMTLGGSSVILAAFVAWWRTRREDEDALAVDDAVTAGSRRKRGRNAGRVKDASTRATLAAGGDVTDDAFDAADDAERAAAAQAHTAQGGGELTPDRAVRERAELSRQFDQLCAELATLGWPARAPSATPREYAQTIAAAEVPPTRQRMDLTALAELIDRVVLGPQPPSAAVLEQALELLRLAKPA